jgi:murein DD-endopeptidase MepM/ murein hydrolase activator NlpD
MSGVDFGLSSGTNVLAAAAGTVFLAQAVSDSRGPYIVGIDHGGNFATEYWHLSSIASSIKVGVSVTQGSILAKSGAPVGGAAHLHLEFRTGSPNYLTPLSAHGMPIDGYTMDIR